MTIEEILTAKEGEHFEFKTAERRFSYTELQKYASALSNEGGGKIVFGVSDARPRKVVGSQAFDQPERTRKGLISSLHMVETGNVGVKLSEFKQVLPALGDRQIQWLLKSMVKCGVVYSQGKTKAARWYLNSPKGGIDK